MVKPPQSIAFGAELPPHYPGGAAASGGLPAIISAAFSAIITIVQLLFSHGRIELSG